MSPRPLRDVERLGLVHRALPALTTTPELLATQPIFAAAQEALARETDPDVIRHNVELVERLVPRNGPGRVLFLSFLVSVTGSAGHLWSLCRTVWKDGVTPAQRHFFYWQRLVRHGQIQGPPALQPLALYASLLESTRASLRGSRSWIPTARP